MFNRTIPRALASAMATVLPAAALSALVYVTSSDYADHDATVVAALSAYGHSAVVGEPWYALNGTQNLSLYDAVYLQPNYNYNSQMPPLGQTALESYVSNGGGLVTSEWTLWLVSMGGLQTVYECLPSLQTTSYTYNPQHDFVQVTQDPTINAGLPAAFTLPSDNVGGTETNVPGVKEGAVVFYESTYLGTRVGLSGWDHGQGRAADFSTINGIRLMSDPLGARLVSNAIDWVSHGSGARQVTPDTFVVRLGRVNAGGLADLAVIDGQVLQVCKFLVPNQQVAPITVEVEGTSTILNATRMVFRTFSRMNANGLFEETLDLYDWSISAFSPTAVHSEAIGTSFKSVAVTGDGDVSRFVSSSSRVRARYRLRQTGPASSAFWCHDADQAVWFVK